MAGRPPSYKVVMLGEGRVGKTSLVRKFIRGDFNDKEPSTSEAMMFSKKQLIVDDKPVILAVWDTAGQERFRALGPIYYRDANGALLVYDITDAESFARVKSWVRELHGSVGTSISLTVAGNKVDCERERQVNAEEVNAYCRSIGAVHVQTSARTGRGVEEAFASLAAAILRRTGGAGGAAPGAGGPGMGGGAKGFAVDDAPAKPPASKGGCCA